MSYLINPVENENCVFVCYQGQMPSAELSAARSEANRELAQRHWNRLVVDLTQLQSAPTPGTAFRPN